MTRTIDPNLLAALGVAGSPVAIAIQFAVPSAGGGTLTRDVSGLDDEVDFSALANLNDFTDLDADGAWALSGGRLEATFPGGSATRSRLRYDAVGATIGKVIQLFSTRDANVPGDPASSSGFPGALSCIGTNGVGPERWVTAATNLIPRLFQEADITCSGTPDVPIGQTLDEIAIGTQPWSIHFLAPGYAEFRHHNGAGETLSALVTDMPVDGPCGLWVRWEQCNPGGSEFFVQPVGFDLLTIMSDPWIRVTGLPAGWTFELVTPVSGFNNLISTKAGVGTAAIQRLRASAAPFQTIQLRDSTGALAGVSVSDGDTHWGDQFSYAPANPTPLLNLCSSDRPLELFGQTFEGVGPKNLSFDGIVESGTKDQQGVTLQVDAIDLDLVVNALKDTRHRGGIVRIWLVHYDPASGTPVGTPLMINEGFSQGGFEVSEEVPEDPREPAESRISGRVSSVMAENRQVRGLRTNLNVHQRFYPGDTFFKNVVRIEGQPIYWGRDAPARARPGFGSPFTSD